MTGRQNRHQDVGTPKSWQGSAVQNGEKEKSRRAQVSKHGGDAARLVGPGSLDKKIQQQSTLYAEHRTRRTLNNSMRMRAQSAQRFMHGAAPQHDQIGAFLARFFGDGGYHLTHGNPQRKIQSGRLQHAFNPVTRLCSQFLLQCLLAFERQPIANGPHHMQQLQARAHLAAEIERPSRQRQTAFAPIQRA